MGHWRFGGGDAKAGRMVGNTVEVGGIGDDPKRSHGINESGDETATGGQVKGGRDRRSGHGAADTIKP